jgi:glycogen operon protein
LNGETEVLLMMLNANAQAVRFLPPAPHLEWHVLLDTAEAQSAPHRLAVGEVEVAAHGLVMLAAQPVGEADWQAGWKAGPQHGPRLLTALPPDPGAHPPSSDTSPST